MNVTLLRQIADVIEKNPECHDQSNWPDEGEVVSDLPCIEADAVHNCGAMACIAGWAVHLTPTDKRPKTETISECAEKLLELGEGEGRILFSVNWQPRAGRTVPEELRRIADQQSVRETATAGWNGTATAGNFGTATAGNFGTATAGWNGTATAGWKGTATAGERGVIVIYRTVGGNRIPAVGVIGDTHDAAGNPLKPKAKYTLNDDGKFIEKTEAKS